MACIQPYWSCLQLGSQHLARQFAANGYDVHYFSAPVTPLHLAKIKSAEVRKRYQNALHSPWTDPVTSIKSYIPFSLIAPDGLPVLKENAVTMNWQKTIIPGPVRYLKKHRLNKADILYIDNLSYHFLLDMVRYDKCVFRIMDRHDGFPGWKGKTQTMAGKIARLADLTIYSALGLEKYTKSLNPQKAAFVPNAVDFDYFQQKTAHAKRHPLLSSIPDPIIIYTGSVDSRFNTNLVMETAGKMPLISFVIAGPPAGAEIPAKLPPNVHFLGPVNHSDLPQLMGSARAGIIPFDVDKRGDLIIGIRPLKLLEYMAAGLPVICARWPEVERMNSPAWLYDSDEEFERLVQKAVLQKHDHQVYKDFVAGNDWSVSFRILMSKL